MSITDAPTQVGFTAFLRTVAGIAVEYLPDNSQDITDAYAVALVWVNQTLAQSPMYALAVYNFGADWIINYATDQTGRTFFTDTRVAYNINLFVPGVTASSGDDGTSQSRLNPEFMKHLTFGDLQSIKTPFGRTYMNIAAQYGSIWGLS